MAAYRDGSRLSLANFSHMINVFLNSAFEVSAQAVEAIREHGDNVAVQLAEASLVMSGAIGAHADDAVGRINVSSGQAVEAIREHGDNVAGQLAAASLAVSGSFGAHGDEVVGRISASSDDVLEAIRTQADSVVVRLAEAASAAGVPENGGLSP